MEKRELHGLVLSRERHESVMIGDDIEVRVEEIRPGKVRLMFAVPREIPVHRREIYEAVQAEKAAAAQVRVGAAREPADAK